MNFYVYRLARSVFLFSMRTIIILKETCDAMILSIIMLQIFKSILLHPIQFILIAPKKSLLPSFKLNNKDLFIVSKSLLTKSHTTINNNCLSSNIIRIFTC